MACQCYSDIRGWTAQSIVPPALELAYAQWVNSFLAHGAGDQTAGVCADGAQFALLRLLQPLSLGAGLSLTYALSSAYQYPLSGGGQRVKKKTSLLHGRQVLQDADRLVQRISAGERIELRMSQRTVTVALLFEAMSKAICPEDKSIALSILSCVFRQGGRTKWSGQYGQLSQLPLF